MSSYAGRDPCTDIVLDLIAEHESAGNYDAVIGDAHSSHDLSGKTLGDIYDLMGDLLLYGQPSTAVGRYQIIRKTLQSLQESKGLQNDALFTPKLQDDLALSLMIGRGYSEWWTGQMTDAEFAHGLSCEWASLPDPEADGRSHYDGVGPNHAGTTLAHVYDALRRAKAAQKPAPELVADAAPGGFVGWLKGLFGGVS